MLRQDNMWLLGMFAVATAFISPDFGSSTAWYPCEFGTGTCTVLACRPEAGKEPTSRVLKPQLRTVLWSEAKGGGQASTPNYNSTSIKVRTCGGTYGRRCGVKGRETTRPEARARQVPGWLVRQGPTQIEVVKSSCFEGFRLCERSRIVYTVHNMFMYVYIYTHIYIYTCVCMYRVIYIYIYYIMCEHIQPPVNHV